MHNLLKSIKIHNKTSQILKNMKIHKIQNNKPYIYIYIYIYIVQEVHNTTNTKYKKIRITLNKCLQQTYIKIQKT